MKRLVLIIAAVALVVPATAAAKGPSGASINGPGTGGGINVGGSGGGDPSAGTRLGDLTLNAGFFPAMFSQSPDPMLDGRPRGDLGPKYTITWTVPGPGATSKVQQDVYPYADGGAVTYMKPGQRFWDGARTRGGWYAGGAALKQTLVSLGLPRTAPSTSSAGWFAASNGGMWATFAAALVAAAAGAVLVRRRARPATA